MVACPLALVHHALYPIPVRRPTNSLTASFSVALAGRHLAGRFGSCDQVPRGLSPPSQCPCRAHKQTALEQVKGCLEQGVWRTGLARCMSWSGFGAPTGPPTEGQLPPSGPQSGSVPESTIHEPYFKTKSPPSRRDGGWIVDRMGLKVPRLPAIRAPTATAVAFFEDALV